MSTLFEGHGYTLRYAGPPELKDCMGWKTAGSAGFDLICVDRPVIDKYCVVINTGLHIESCDPTLFGMIAIRSSLARSGWMLLNSVGVIDSDYRDEIRLLVSPGDGDIWPGDRVAQIIFTQFRGSLYPLTGERSGGFGSTGR